MRGKLIVVEGTDCSGKETQTNKLVEKLPEPSEKYRGHFRMIENNGNDTLYVCLKINGVFIWVDFSKGIDNTSPILGVALLDMMVLG